MCLLEGNWSSNILVSFAGENEQYNHKLMSRVGNQLAP